MALLGKEIILKGLSQKGKNRVRDHGERWVVLAETDRVLFAPDKTGPWVFVAPTGKGQDDKASRWVRVVGDADFSVNVVGS
jgi:hypothetical protein